MRRAGDALHAKTAIDNGMVVDVVIVDDGGLMENLRHARPRHTEGTRMPVAKMVRRNKHKTVSPSPKSKSTPTLTPR